MLTLSKGAVKAGNFKTDGGGISVQSQTNSIARTDTSAKALFKLPKGAIVKGIRIWTDVLSNAGTTATISVGKTGSATFFVNAFDVKGGTARAQNDPVATNLFASVGAADIQVEGIYAETGGASSTGGPFWVTVDYYLP